MGTDVGLLVLSKRIVAAEGIVATLRVVAAHRIVATVRFDVWLVCADLVGHCSSFVDGVADARFYPT